MEKLLTPIARIFIAHIFLLAGLSKITDYASTQAYMEAMGVSGMMLPMVIALEVAGGLALIIGYQTRWAAFSLAGFTVVAAVMFHANDFVYEKHVNCGWVNVVGCTWRRSL